MADLCQQAGRLRATAGSCRWPVCAGLFRSRLWACVHAPRTSPTPNPKVSTARHTHPPPSASHGMRHERGDCRQIDGGCQVCIIRIACSCHSTLTHAHDMRFAACHPCTCSCLTCLTCMRRFPAADSPRAGATRGDPEPGSKSGAATLPTSHHSFTLLHTCPP